MPRVVRMGKRKKKKEQFKVDKKCRIGRTYQNFLKFMEEHPGLLVVEMDSFEGKRRGKSVAYTTFYPTTVYARIY